MALRRTPEGIAYHLIAYDRRGAERTDPGGRVASDRALDDLARSNATDVFVLSHGWLGDYDDAVAQYDAWLAGPALGAADGGVRPFVIGLHWPSKAWSDRELRIAAAERRDDAAPAAGSVSLADAVEDYAAHLGDGARSRDALATVLAYAAGIDPGTPLEGAERLPPDVAGAYRALATAVRGGAGDPLLLPDDWDPDAVFADLAEARARGDRGPGGVGEWLRRLREAVLAPLRQLTFWHSQNQAHEFGEGAASALLRRIMGVTGARVHLVGHSFGAIVTAGAVRGPGALPEPPPRPVDSLLLMQGALSLWAFAAHAPRRFGGGSGRYADVATSPFVAGPIVATRSRWDYAVGRFYPFAVGLVGEYLLVDELPKFGGIGTWGIQGVPGTIELPPLQPNVAPSGRLVDGRVHNIDASAVISRLEGAAGAHNDVAHPELRALAWRAALAQPAGEPEPR
jgi:hypothetical protein